MDTNSTPVKPVVSVIGHILHRFDCGADFSPSLGRNLWNLKLSLPTGKFKKNLDFGNY